MDLVLYPCGHKLTWIFLDVMMNHAAKVDVRHKFYFVIFFAWRFSMQHFRPKKHVLAVAITTLFCTHFSPQLSLAQAVNVQPAASQSADEKPTAVIVTGTRTQNRSATNTLAPVDVISAESLQNLGVSEINQGRIQLRSATKDRF
jgi:hypothetical protein